MPNRKSDNNDYRARSDDRERDLGTKVNPSYDSDRSNISHEISKPYKEDLQAQKAAKDKKENKKKTTGKVSRTAAKK